MATLHEAIESAVDREAGTFTCADCGRTLPLQTSGGTGYGTTSTQPTQVICYDCCAVRDRADMQKVGRATMYLVKRDGQWFVTNWPGTLEYRAGPPRIGRHNIAGRRYDVWFADETGAEWHGVQIGDNTQIVRVRRNRGG